MTGQDRIRVVAVVCLGLLLSLLWKEWSRNGDGWFPVWFRGILLLILGICTTVSLHISILPACRYSPASLLVYQYLFDALMTGLGVFYFHKLENQTTRCQEAQEEFLQTLLERHKDTAYGTDHHFSSVKSCASFRQEHPLTVHSYYGQYLEQVAAGKENIMIPGKPLRLCLTSGTTGQRKMVPQSKTRTRLFISKFVPIGQRILRKNFLPSYSPLLKTCYLYTHSTPTYASSGITMGPTTMLNLPDFLYRLQYSTPPAGMRLTNEKQALYVHLLFALHDEDIQALFAIFASTLYYAFKTLEEEWPNLVNDLRQGCISDSINLEYDVKVTLEAELPADPQRADELEREFKKGFDDIARRIWPRMSSLWGVSSGSMTVYRDILKDKYIKDLPIVSMIYNSTEALLGVLNGKAESTEYITFPGDIFYEFIPFEKCRDEKPDTLLAEEVRIGESYEVVVTTMDGLYRYRMGDVVRVTGFYNKTPILEFLHRVGDILDLQGEKTPEISIKAALQKTLVNYEHLYLVDFTCLESKLLEQCAGSIDQSEVPCYIVIAEIDGVTDEIGDQVDCPKLAAEVDINLRQLCSPYSSQREDGTISPLKLILVKAKTFGEFRTFLAERTHASSMQVKVPKVLRTEEFTTILLERALKSKP